jgi:hypothetical protein
LPRKFMGAARLVNHAGALLLEEGLGGVVELAGAPARRGLGEPYVQRPL